MPETNTLKETIRHYAQTVPVREHTGNVLRDTTYDDMLSAGHGLRQARDSATVQRTAKALALGIEAWYPDTTVFGALPLALLEAGSGRDPNALGDLVDKVAGYEESDAGDEGLRGALEHARHALGLSAGAVTAPSLLLHFLAPGYCPVLGRRVARALDRHGEGFALDFDLYAHYAAALRELGLTDHDPNPPQMTAFGDVGENAATRVRRVDCTLWHVGSDAT